MFLEIYKNVIDETKENCLFITKDYLNGERKMQFGQNKYIIESLKEKYNVFFLDLNRSNKLAEQFKNDKNNNHIIFNFKKWAEFKEGLLRKRGSDKSPREVNDYNLNKAFSVYEDIFSDLIIDRIFIQAHSYSVIPSTEYAKGRDNSFHDYVGNDKNELKEIADLNEILYDRIYDFVAPPLAFMFFINFIFYSILQYLAKSGNVKSCNIVQDDPSITWSYAFERLGIPNTNIWYFVDDNRGTRNLKGFPLLQFKVMCGLSELKKPLFSKRMKFLYNGSLLNNRGEGERNNQWDKYLKDLDLKDSSIYTFLKFNSDGFLSGTAKSNEDKIKDAGFYEMYESIKNHKMYKGMHEKNSEFQIAQNYDYVLCLKPLTKYDSLNQKPGYCMVNTLPLLAEEYDPENLFKLPTDIKEKLTVKSSEDIKKKIAYFDENENERIEIIDRLKKHFQFEHIQKNYKDIIKKIF